MRTVRLSGSALVSPLALWALGGCLEFGPRLDQVAIWAVPEHAALSAQSLPEPENDVFHGARATLRLNAAVNETISLQVALRGGNSPAEIWNFSLSELRQDQLVIPAEQAQFFREERIPVSEYPSWFLRLTPDLRQPREYADVLVPLQAPRGLPLRIAAGQTAAVWLDLRVPPGTEPGIYRGKLRITARSGAPRELDLELEVWPFALPQTRHLAMLTGLNTTTLLRHHLEAGGQPYAPARLSFDDPVYAKAVGVLDGAVRLLHEHRCSPILGEVYPLAKLSAQGLPELDWTDYDRLVAGILDGTLFEERAAATAWAMPVSEHHPAPESHGGWGSPSHRQALVEHVRQSSAHFRQKGWFERHFVAVRPPVGERGRAYEEFAHLSRLLLSVDPGLKLLCSLPPQPMGPYGLLEDPYRELSVLVGIWCPPAGLADPAELSRQQSMGKVAWFSPDRPPFSGSLSAMAPALHPRTLAWQAFRLGCSGIYMPEVNRWPDGGAPAVEDSELSLIWPGRPYGLEQPVPSIRLKRLRRGLQDYEYLWLLTRNGRPGIAQLIAADLFAFGGTLAYGEHFLDGRAGGWVTDPTAWSTARRLMARELTAVLRADRGASTRPANEDDELRVFERQLEWARLTEATRGLRAEVEGVRIGWDERSARAPLLVEATLTLFNATREPFSGVLRFAGVPQEWGVDELKVPIEKLEARRAARRILSARVPGLAANPDGVLLAGVAVEDPQGLSRVSSARICAVTSQKLTQPLTLDGRLDDWPLGTTNVAGDFVLVGAMDTPKQQRSSPDRASQQTVVFVCNDSDNLYIAFNCADDRLGERVISRGNTVRYDELWPAGEDLVEVVLDPTHRAVDPGELLHFVVKSNGAVTSERGVPCLAGVARHSDWPAGVEAALDDTAHPDRWTVEIRIPIRALGGRPGMWGINFGRFQARLGEYSSWSGARRYLYSPVSLGNLRVEF